MPNSSNIQIAATRPLLFTKTCLALRMMLERKLYFIWTSLSFSLSESRGCTELAGTPETWLPTPLELASQRISKKDLLGSCRLKWGNMNCHCPQWHSLWTKGFSIRCLLSFQVWRAQTWLSTKGSSWWSDLLHMHPRTCNSNPQSKGTFLVRWEFRHVILINVNASRVSKSLYTTLRVYSKTEISLRLQHKPIRLGNDTSLVTYSLWVP